jgi:CBS-domain-containing membrane protein
VVERLRDHRVSAVPVVDAERRVIGVVSEADLLLIAVRLVKAVEGVVAVENRLRWKLDDTTLEVPQHPLAPRHSADERP